jgi:hypothetical protein
MRARWDPRGGFNAESVSCTTLPAAAFARGFARGLARAFAFAFAFVFAIA